MGGHPDLYPQRVCHTQANAELEELLRGLKRRFALLGLPEPEIAVVDNCCHVKNAYLNVFPAICVCLDVWHFMMRSVYSSGRQPRTDESLVRTQVPHLRYRWYKESSPL